MVPPKVYKELDFTVYQPTLSKESLAKSEELITTRCGRWVEQNYIRLGNLLIGYASLLARVSYTHPYDIQ
jgi:hypothetical protein